MNVNVFEGGRRLRTLATGAIVLIGAFVAYSDDPVIQRKYLISHTGTATRVDDCPSTARQEFKWNELGGKVNATLCFPTDASGGPGGELITTSDPALGKPGYVMVYPKWSDEANAYIDKATQNFALPKGDRAEVLEEYAADRKKRLLSDIGVTCGIAFAFWLSCAVLGWILRGFLGIPTGADSRPKPSGD